MPPQPNAFRNVLIRGLKFVFAIFLLALGLGQLRLAPSNGFGLFVSICTILLALEIAYSAVMGRWHSALGALVLEQSSARRGRFLVIEPPSADELPDVERSVLSSPDQHASDQSTFHHSLPDALPNPYAPPVPAAAGEVDRAILLRQSILSLLSERFLEGRQFMHQGVVLFLDAEDDSVIHAALPLGSPSPARIELNVQEALRVLADFLAELPQVVPSLVGRSLVCRMISTYDELDVEVAERVVVPWSTIIAPATSVDP